MKTLLRNKLKQSLTCAARVAACAVFAMAVGAAHAQQFTIYGDLHDFGGSVKNANGAVGPDGAGPSSNVSFDSAGNMYGTTAYGGPNPQTGQYAGLVWEITKSGQYIDLHDFGGTVTNADGSPGPDGEVPYAGVSFDSAGNMYGTALFGGPNGNDDGFSGIVWEISKSGQYIDLHDFGGGVTNANGTGGTDGGNPYGGVTIDGTGNLYGTCSAGGPNQLGIDGAGMVWEITNKGVYLDLHDFGGSVTNAGGSQGPDGYMSYAGVTLDANGDLYGTTAKSGPNNGGMLWEITAGGQYIDLHDFGGLIPIGNDTYDFDGYLSYSPVTIDAQGDLYGTTVDGGARNYGMVWKLTESNYTDLHDFGGSAVTRLGANTTDGFYPYSGVTVNAAGNLYGTTTCGGAANEFNVAGIVWELTTAGIYIVVHDFGETVTDASGSQAPDGYGPWESVAVDSSGNLYGTAPFGGLNGEGNGGNGLGIVWSLIQCPLKLTISPTSVLGGQSATGTLKLGTSPLWTGLSVALSSSDASVTVPASVMAPPGTEMVTFTIHTAGVSAATTATITAGLGLGQQSATLALQATALSSLSLSPSPVGGGLTATGTVTLTSPPGFGGISVLLSSSGAGAAVPATVVVPAGQTSGTFTITTSAVTKESSVTIGASLRAVSKTSVLTITPAALAQISVSPSIVYGGTLATGTVALTADSFTGGFPLTLSSSAPAVIVPKSVTIAAGANSGTFAVKTEAVAKQETVTITAKSGKVIRTTSITLRPPVLTALTLNPPTARPGGTATGTVSINSPAPAGGIPVTIAASSKSVTSPTTVRIASGKTSATFTISVTKKASAGVVTITATYSGVSEKAVLTIG